MRFASVCSGVEAASLAWEPLGWKAEFFSEIDPFANAVLAERYPDVPNFGDLNAFHEWPDATFDLLVGGTPCQSFSVAGLRQGLADPRGNLALDFLGVADRYRPRWIVWENVPGVLSSNGGRDFGAFLGALVELGYGFAYRVLDARFFGVPQRRRRVFVVGHLGGWRGPAAVLLEPSRLFRRTPKSGTAREAVAPTLASRARGGGGLGTDAELDGGLIVSGTVRSHCRPGSNEVGSIVAQPLAFDENQITHRANRNRHFDTAPSVVTHGKPPTLAFNIYPASGQGTDIEASETDVAAAVQAVSNARKTDRGTRVVSFKPSHYTRGKDGAPSDTVPPLQREADKGDQDPVMLTPAGVRRLTPLECERLQGFPDNWTLVTYNGAPANDTPRYKAIGNSIAVPKLRWIGVRIALADEVLHGR